MDIKKILKIIQENTPDDAAEKIMNLIEPPVKIDFDKFLDFFNSVTNKKIRKIDDKAKRQLRKLVSDGYTKSDIAKAIRNCASDPYHMENKHYLTPEFITRQDKFIKYLHYSIDLPDDWWNRELTERQRGSLSPEQLHQWVARKKVVEMEGGRLKPIKI